MFDRLCFLEAFVLFCSIQFVWLTRIVFKRVVFVIRVGENELKSVLCKILESREFTAGASGTIADVFVENNLEGVDSHGLARFPNFVKGLDRGTIKVTEGPEVSARFGAWEQWDGLCGAGPLNARAGMKRAMELARESGLGCVAMRRTNHWMRGGTYGKQAAEAGMIGICWTNTMPNLEPWGGSNARLGNNPLVLAAPLEGAPVVMDMAMTQFSYGKLEQHRLSGESLPVDGGFDSEGKVSRNAEEILETGRLLPAGFWKGSGLAFVLDLLAGLLSSGNMTSDISKMPGEQQVSQIFMAFDIEKSDGSKAIQERVLEAVKWMQGEESDRVRYPGQRAAADRRERESNGIPFSEDLWESVRSL